MPRNNKETKTTKTAKATRTTTAARRGAASPAVNKSQAEKYLGKVPENQVFWCNNGVVLRDVRELKDALANMSDQTFCYHSNEIKKDFSTWVRDIIGDDKLAKDLEKATNREEAVKIVEERCQLLVSKMST